MEQDQRIGAAKSVEGQVREPFVVRAHHIDLIRNFLNSERSASDFVNEYVEFARGQLASQNTSRRLRSYLRDVLGDTPEQLDIYRRNEAEFFEEFLGLSSDFPVKIVEGKKDKICEGCAIGEHCSKRSILERFSEDHIYISRFREVAKEHNFGDDLAVVDETATYSKGKPRKVKSILTTAGTIKRVIKSGWF